MAMRGITDLEAQARLDCKLQKADKFLADRKSPAELFTERVINKFEVQSFVNCSFKQNYINFTEFQQVNRLANDHIQFGYDTEKYFLVSFRDTLVVMVSEKGKVRT